MSADNGVYIGSFPKADGTKEYRVIEAQAIENCDYTFSDPDHNDPSWHTDPPRQLSDETKRLQDCQRLVYYGAAKVFATHAEAWAEANRIYDEEFGDGDICEYGIGEIEYTRPLPEVSVEAAQAELDAWLETVRLKQAEAEADRERNTREYYVLVPVKVREYQGTVNHCGLSAETIVEYRDKVGHVSTKEEVDSAIDTLKELWEEHHNVDWQSLSELGTKK